MRQDSKPHAPICQLYRNDMKIVMFITTQHHSLLAIYVAQEVRVPIRPPKRTSEKGPQKGPHMAFTKKDPKKDPKN